MVTTAKFKPPPPPMICLCHVQKGFRHAVVAAMLTFHNLTPPNPMVPLPVMGGERGIPLNSIVAYIGDLE